MSENAPSGDASSNSGTGVHHSPSPILNFGYINAASTKDSHNVYNIDNRVDNRVDNRNITKNITIFNAHDTLEEDSRKVLEWLGGLDTDHENQRNWKLRAKGTCEWVLSDESYKCWLNRNVSPILWICGKPGAGKSVMLGYIIHHLRNSLQRDGAVVLHFFFKYDATQTNPLVTMAATVIRQLIRAGGTTDAAREYDKTLSTVKKWISSKEAHCTDFGMAWRLFLSLASLSSSNRTLYLMIDALDECALHEEFLEELSETDWGALNIRMILTSRPDSDIKTILEPLTTGLIVNLTSEVSKVDRDIRLFIEEKAATKKYRKLRPFRDEIISTLSEKSKGMFRYAALMLDELCQRPEDTVEQILHSVPPGLNGIYTWILGRLPQTRSSIMIRKKVLTWVALASRPLTVYDMALTCATKEGEKDFNPARKALVDEEDILTACGPLIEITPIDTLQFTHFSVKEFLLVQGHDLDKLLKLLPNTNNIKEYFIQQPSLAHLSILQICMTQLLSRTFLKHHAKTTSNKLVYSITNWIDHAIAKGADSLDVPEAHQTWSAVAEFLTGMSYSEWKLTCGQGSSEMVSYKSGLVGWRDVYEPRFCAISMCALFGLTKALDNILKSERELQKILGWAGTNHPLSLAAERGHTEILRRLLDKGERVDKEGAYCYTPLCSAARGGHIDTVRLLLDHGASIEAETSLRQTPLHLAAERGNIEIVKLLLDRGANRDIKNNYKHDSTPLGWAVIRGYIAIVKMLLDSGANIEAETHSKTPLLHAIEEGHIEILKLLLDRGANIEARAYGNTSLHYAAEKGHIETLKLLLDKGADVDARDGQGCTALYSAAVRGHVETLKLLLDRGASVDQKDSYGNTPLYSTAQRGNIQAVKLLLGRGANFEVMTCTDRWKPLLFSAAENGHTEIVKLFLDRGTDVNKRDRYGCTLLYSAATMGHMETVKLLLDRGASIDVTDSSYHWHTLLRRATEAGYTEVIKLLLDRGADVNKSDEYGNTALTSAAQRGNIEIVKLLLDKGADIEAKAHSESALRLAISNDHMETAKFLLDRGADTRVMNYYRFWTTQIISAAEKGYTEIVKLLLDNGGYVKAVNNFGFTPLSAAAKRGHIETVKLLLDKGADIEDTYDKKALPFAAENGHAEIVKLLLEKQADVEARVDNKTPLILAAENGHTETMELLLSKGADMEARDGNGDTPLSSAAKLGRVESVKLLLDRGVDIEVKAGHNRTPLLLAAEKGHIETVNLLLDRGANIEATDSFGHTYSSLAAQYRYLQDIRQQGL